MNAEILYNTKMKELYPFVVKFKKKFFGQHILAGLEINDSLSFISRESAQRWIDGINKYKKRNGYLASDFVISAK